MIFCIALTIVTLALAFVTMAMVRHGDNKIESKKGLEAFDIDD